MIPLTPTERKQIMIERLTQALSPTYLNIIDDSHLHVGHAGAKGGASHFTVEISSPHFIGLSLIAQHRLIYAELSDLIPLEVHALKIRVI